MATLIDAAESDPELTELSAAFTYQRREAVRAISTGASPPASCDPGIDTDLAAQLVGGHALLPAPHAAPGRGRPASSSASSTWCWTASGPEPGPAQAST